MPFSSAPPTLLYENPAGRLLADSKGFLRVEWLPGSHDQVAVQQLLEQELGILQKTGWGRVLSKLEHLGPQAPETIDWTLHNWLPRAAGSCSYRWGALLVAGNEQAVAASRAVLEKAGSQYRIQFQFFSCELSAEQWLLAQY
ncbi:hypothetical protein ACFPAF_06705 [Hymenobacter endophyticus]|uniref:STAS/SEC14 domain-containing protein n=1 Tax=Hymenobacter endophyticus TaxID=3076335 RepID=A0ABU3TFC9_9BACT|nr:hypothetical protein [Hymenobacter endophyticus]MDU0370075.1 hypothetical protein [Hymenobacter endophyticus]